MDEADLVAGPVSEVSSNDDSDGVSRSPSDEFLRLVAQASLDDGEREPQRFASVIADRFEIQSRLGAGGFGTVYAVFDRERSTTVALKTANRCDPRALYRFKQEFRALAELAHPHLAQLYELHSDGEQWFFTMELIVGRDAHSHLRADGTVDEPRLRTLFRQLSEAVSFLHGSGHLHCDIKPSNVVVADASAAWPHGRAVLLDFGLIADLGRAGPDGVGATVGTPHYMAPEQAAGLRVGPAADWYAVGAMLYKALTGRLPFEGSAEDCLRDKQSREPPPLPARASGTATDLDRLCMDLLRRSPELRPAGPEILARLSRSDGDTPGPGSSPPPGDGPRRTPAALIGRAEHRARLREAFATARSGGTVVALVHGLSGMGKSALAAQLLDDLREEPSRPVVLAGRCFEQESVPYKALDGVVDALGHELARWPTREVDAILPHDTVALARLFPVLRQVRAVDEAPRRGDGAGKLELRRHGFAALRELCARLAARRTLVIFIDDLQWGDVDSAVLLAELLAPPDPPAMLLVLAFRSDEADRNEGLRALLSTLRATAAIDVVDVEVERLDATEATAVALAALGDRGTLARAEAVARESGGWPFFIRELARYWEATPETAPRLDGALSLANMIAERVAALPDEARRLLEVLALAGQPLERAVAGRVAELAGDEPAVLGLLRRARLLRTRGGGVFGELEPYHDRIRETVLAGIDEAARRRLHQRLGPALLATGRADPETLATHFLGADQPEQATELFIVAADRALEALGFDRSARCARQALALLAPGDPRTQMVQEKLGDALASAGRNAEAAAAFLAAVAGAGDAQDFGLRRRAAEHYLISGHLEEGVEVLRSVLTATGLSMPTTPRSVLWRLVPLLLLLWWRGLRFRERPASEVPPLDLLRIDVCGALRVGLGNVDPLQAMYFHKRLVWLALRAGEPQRVLRALGYETAVRAGYGREQPSRFDEELSSRAHELIARVGDPGVLFRTERAIGLTLRGRFAEARPELEGVEAQMRESSAGVANELSLCRFYLVQALYHLGAWRELARRQADFLQHARARGDRSLEANLLSLTGHVPALMADEPAAARAEVERATALWTRPNQFQHYARLIALGSTALYAQAGRGEAALDICTERWPAVVSSRLMRISWGVRAQCHFFRGGARLAAAAVATGARREILLRGVDRDARVLSRTGARVGHAYAHALRAAVCASREDRAGALRHLGEAEARFTALEMSLCAAAAVRRRGELLGGPEGGALTTAADVTLSAQDVRDPGRMTALLLPGLWA